MYKLLPPVISVLALIAVLSVADLDAFKGLSARAQWDRLPLIALLIPAIVLRIRVALAYAPARKLARAAIDPYYCARPRRQSSVTPSRRRRVAGAAVGERSTRTVGARRCLRSGDGKAV